MNLETRTLMHAKIPADSCHSCGPATVEVLPNGRMVVRIVSDSLELTDSLVKWGHIMPPVASPHSFEQRAA